MLQTCMRKLKSLKNKIVANEATNRVNINLNESLSPIPSAFSRQFEQIKKSTWSMYNAASVLETKESLPGNYWEMKDSLVRTNNYWFRALQNSDETIYNKFRSFVNEDLSGSPFGDYSQFAHHTEEDFLNIKPVNDYFTFIQDIPSEYHMEERHFNAVKQWGFKVKNKQISADVIRFQRYISNLYLSGILPNLKETAKSHPLHILEIGAGFGMLSEFVLSTLPENTKLIIVDLPHMLALAATYFAIVRPNMKQAFCDPNAAEKFNISEEIKKSDILFIPNYAVRSLLDLPYIDLALNSFSFQEMSEENLHLYSEVISKVLKGYLYSDNFRRHPHNYSLRSRVSDILRQYFHIFPESEESYTNIEHQKVYMWQTYLHIGTSKANPIFSKMPTDYGNKLWGENYMLDLTTGECEF